MEAGSFVAYNLVGSRIYVDNDKKWEIHPLFAGRREENLGHEVRWKVILPYLEARLGRGRGSVAKTQHLEARLACDPIVA